MQSYCDRCNEQEDHPIDLTADAEVAEIAAELGYRNVCAGCYDDLVAEAQEARDQQAEDRRAEQRLPVAIPIRIEPSDGREPVETVTEDISENGARIRTALALDPGSVVHIRSQNGEVDAMAIVEVIWHDAGMLRAGLRLVENSDSWATLYQDLKKR